MPSAVSTSCLHEGHLPSNPAAILPARARCASAPSTCCRAAASSSFLSRSFLMALASATRRARMGSVELMGRVLLLADYRKDGGGAAPHLMATPPRVAGLGWADG